MQTRSKTKLLAPAALVLAGCFISAPVMASLVDADKVELLLTLDGTIADSSIYGHTGSAIGGGPTATIDRYGSASGAMHFDGNDSIIFTDNDIINSTAGTVLAWVRSDNLTKLNADIVGAQTCGGMLFQLHAGDVAMGGQCNTPWSRKDGANVGDNNWHFVAGVYDSTTIQLYLDGVQVFNGAAVGVLDSTADFGIGGVASGNEYFEGDIDDLRIMSTALTSTDIANLMAAESPTDTSVPAPGSLLLAAPFLIGLLRKYHRNA